MGESLESEGREPVGQAFWTVVPDSRRALALFDEAVAGWHAEEPPLTWPPPGLAGGAARGLAADVRRLGWVNCFQWHLEDACRAHYEDVPVIARLKYDIDASNGRRVAMIDAINEQILAAWEGLGVTPDGLPVALDTPGSVYDRLSILVLKRYHHRATAVQAMLAAQIGDLGLGLDGLLADLEEGRVRFRVYRSFKLYGSG